MNEKVIFEDAQHLSTYFYEDGNLIVRLTDKLSGAYYDTVYDSKQAHKAAKKYEVF